MKMKILFTIALVVASYALADAEIKNKINDTETILRGLDATTWQERCGVLNNYWKVLTTEKWKNNIEIKTKIISALEREYQFRNNYINSLKKNGATEKDAEKDFKENYEEKGFDGYVCSLTDVVIQYNDLSTISLIMMTESLYPSDAIGIHTYQRFGKKAIAEIVRISKEGTEKQKITAFSTLTGWVNLSLNDVGMPKEVRLKRENILRSDEISAIKQRMIDGLNTNNIMQISYINEGLFKLAKAARSDSEKIEIKNIFKKYLDDKNISIRKDAIRYLGDIGEASDIKDIEKCLNDLSLDKYVERKHARKARGLAKTDIEKVYPIRDAAKEAIEKIKAREGGK